MSEINPDNKCSHLYKQFPEVKNPLKTIFELQEKLQNQFGHDFNKMNYKERIEYIGKSWRNLCIEFGELMQRLPYKEWKKYKDQQISWPPEKEELKEIQFEWIDASHFLINICLALGIRWEEFRDIYLSKNKENFERQKRGY